MSPKGSQRAANERRWSAREERSVAVGFFVHIADRYRMPLCGPPYRRGIRNWITVQEPSPLFDMCPDCLDRN